MAQKELINEFIAARWKTSEDMRAFVKTANSLTPEDIAGMLEFIMTRKSSESPQHSMRVRAFAELSAGVRSKGLFNLYLQALKGNDRHIRAVLVPQFPNVVDPPLLPKICELLRSSDTSLRRAACQILQKVADGNVLKLLGDMFAERNFAGRNETIDIAGGFVSHFSMEFFKTVLLSGNPDEKIRALKYLGNPVFIRDHSKSIAQAVKKALHDTDETVLTEVIPLFSRVCTEEEYFISAGDYLYHQNPGLVRGAISGLRQFSSERTAAVLERKFHIGPNAIRMAVLDCIEHIGTIHIVKPLVKALEHKQEPIRVRALDVLKKLVKTEKIELADSIISMLRSDHANVRSAAVEVARLLPEKAKVLLPDILAHLRVVDWWERQRLLNPLVEMAGQELTPHVLAYMKDPSDLVRHFALDILRRLKTPAALESLLEMVTQDTDWWVREKAIYAIAEINDPRTVAFLLNIAVKEPDFGVVVLNSLRNMRATVAAPRIVPFLSADNPDLRLAALQCLEVFNDTAYADHVRPLTRDKDLRVNQVARAIAGEWNIDFQSITSKKEEALSPLDRLLILIKNGGGDDLILLPGNPPYMKRRGKTVPAAKALLSLEQMIAILKPVLNPQQQRDLLNLRDVDFSYEVRSEGLRFRANVFSSRTGISAVFRIIKGDVWKLEDLGLPSVVSTFGDFKDGLVLVGGPTGSGKSTTLSSIISHINRTSRRHVLSIEDPIEVVHKAQMGIVNQREVGVHTASFNQALRMTLREDPDVILVGEMRDLPTIQYAVTAAETGHLVFGTVHTVSADSSIDRLINAYPPESQEQVRSMLSDSLKAVLCQYLIRHKEKPEMVLASEIMINNQAISNLIRKGKTFQISSVITTSKEQQMQLMDSSLLELYKRGKISMEDALLKARNKAEFEELAGIKDGFSQTDESESPANMIKEKTK